MSVTAKDLLIRKVRSIAALTDAERDALADLPILIRDFPSRTDVVTQGEVPSHCCLLVSGLMIRYRITRRGERPIVNLHVPGDIPDLQSLHLSVMDHHLASLTPVTIGMIPHAPMREVAARFPALASALWRITLIDAALLRERVVTLAQHSAANRLAHLLCETFVRLRAVGLTDGQTMHVQLTQIELGDMLGMSTVHMNRVIRDLRDRGLVVTVKDAITLPDFGQLAALADFDPLYLHLGAQDRIDPP